MHYLELLHVLEGVDKHIDKVIKSEKGIVGKTRNNQIAREARQINQTRLVP